MQAPATILQGPASRWKSARLIPFYCFMFSGIALDAYFTWYSFEFDRQCSASLNSVPVSFLFTPISAIAASTSVIFGRSLLYRILCLAVWVFYLGCTIYMNWESASVEHQFGINCYRRVWGAAVVTHYFTAYFVAAIVAITVAAGLFVLARRLVPMVWSKRSPALPVVLTQRRRGEP